MLWLFVTRHACFALTSDGLLGHRDLPTSTAMEVLPHFLVSLNAVCFHGTLNFVSPQACLSPSSSHSVSRRDLSHRKPGSHSLPLRVLLTPGWAGCITTAQDQSTSMRQQISLPDIHLDCRCFTEFGQSSTGSVVINAMLPRRRCLKAQKHVLLTIRCNTVFKEPAYAYVPSLSWYAVCVVVFCLSVVVIVWFPDLGLALLVCACAMGHMIAPTRVNFSDALSSTGLPPLRRREVCGRSGGRSNLSQSNGCNPSSCTTPTRFPTICWLGAGAKRTFNVHQR